MRELGVNEVLGLVRADEIEEGECFRKKTGTYIYLRISEASMCHYLGKSKTLSSIYGVCLLNGNITNVPKNMLVVREQVGWKRIFTEDSEEEE